MIVCGGWPAAVDTTFVRSAHWSNIGKRPSASFAGRTRMAVLIELPKSSIASRRWGTTNLPSQKSRSRIRKQEMTRIDPVCLFWKPRLLHLHLFLYILFELDLQLNGNNGNRRSVSVWWLRDGGRRGRGDYGGLRRVICLLNRMIPGPSSIRSFLRRDLLVSS